jgi:hypothetical protein
MNIINALITNDLIIKHFVELDEDYLDNFPELNHQGIPLTFAIKAKRTQS